jgi:hypothetical protein
MAKIKLAIAEDNEKARKAIIRFIQTEKDLEVVLEAEKRIAVTRTTENDSS